MFGLFKKEEKIAYNPHRRRILYVEIAKKNCPYCKIAVKARNNIVMKYGLPPLEKRIEIIDVDMFPSEIPFLQKLSAKGGEGDVITPPVLIYNDIVKIGLALVDWNSEKSILSAEKQYENFLRGLQGFPMRRD
jgi:hypothetical protein